jgi:hypothetical protein
VPHADFDDTAAAGGVPSEALPFGFGCPGFGRRETEPPLDEVRED